MDKWSLVPIDDEVSFFNIEDTSKDELDIDRTVAVVPITRDLSVAKKRASLIMHSPEMLSLCEKSLEYIPKDSELYSKMSAVLGEILNNGSDDNLNYFDDKTINYDFEEAQEPVLYISFSENKCLYKANSKIEELFNIHTFADNTGLLFLNIDGDFDDDAVLEYHIQYPLGVLISKSVFNSFIAYVKTKFSTIGEFIAEFDTKDEDYSLRDFIEELFYGEFKDDYIRKMTLKEYLDRYPMVMDTEVLSMDMDLPKFLVNCPHSLHSDMQITYRGQSDTGVLVFKEELNKFFVHSTSEQSASLFMIPNDEMETGLAIIEFLDFIDKK